MTEAFVVCENFRPTALPAPLSQPLLSTPYPASDPPSTLAPPTTVSSLVAPFVACGDLSGFDSETYYGARRPAATVSPAPLQPPIAAPYMKYKEKLRKGEFERVGTATL